MSRQSTDKRLPVYSIVAFVFVSLGIVTASVTGWLRNDGAATIELSDAANIPQKMLKFKDHANGSVEIIDASENETLQWVQSGEGFFMRGVLRTLTSERRKQGLGAEMPFELRAESSNRLLLIDKATGRKILLSAFGPENAAFFSQFLDIG